VTLAHGNEVAYLHVDNPAGAAIFGDNVDGSDLHDLPLTRRATAPTGGIDRSLCRVVKTADAVDMSQSVLRGCSGAQAPIGKAAIGAPSLRRLSSRRSVIWPVRVLRS
jgi:hypothetical protein